MNNLLKIENILFENNVKNRDEFFIYLGNILTKNNISQNPKETVNAIKEREKIGSTGFENGIAIPHTRDSSILNPTLLFIKLKNEIDWNALDGKLTNIFFIILFPDNDKSGNEHLELLSFLAENLMDNNFLKSLHNILNKTEMFKLLSDKLFDKKSKENIQNNLENITDEYYVAVVACTFGIAHTYLAEQKLIKYAKDHNFNVKVETYGRKGNLNKINEDDLKKAKGVLIATDKEVDLSHIKHRNIYKVSTGFSIKNTEKCFDVLTGKIKVSKQKEIIKEFFNFKLKQSCMFSIGKVHNYISKIAIIIGILIFFQQFSFSQDFSNKILEISKFSSFIIIPILLALFVYFFTKSETTASSAGVTLFIIQLYLNISNLENYDFSSVGIFGITFYALIVILYHRYIYHLNSKIFKKTKWNGLFQFILQILLVFLVGVVIFYTHSYFGLATKYFYNEIMILNSNYWWFNIIIATLFFSLMVTDMGGPINKWTIIISTLFFIDSFSINSKNIWLTPVTAQVVAITLPGIGAWVRGIIYKNIISENEYQKCISAGKDSMNGISEGALWILKDYKIKGYLWAYLNAIIAGFIIGYFNIQLYGGSNTIFGVIFGISTDNVLKTFGLNYLSLNIGYLILMVLTPFLSGILSILFLHKKENKEL